MTYALHLFRHIILASSPLKPVERPEVTQVRGQLTLVDQSILYVRENHIVATGWIDYSYHWQTADQQLIHRWDNAHEISGIATSPHHQHVGSEENVEPSESMTLEKVLAFIAHRIDGPQLTSN